jgi:signal transduction histidine kinase/ActR/RegA family two-component response regulator/uncharacterized protein YaaQ
MFKTKLFAPLGASWVWSIGAIGAMVVAVASGIVFWMSLANDRSRQMLEVERDRALETIISANAVEEAVVDRQRVMRGALIRKQVEPGDLGYDMARERVMMLSSLVGRNHLQAANASRLATIVEDQQYRVVETTSLIAAGKFGEASKSVLLGTGEQRVAEVREIVGKIVALERLALKERREMSMQMARDTESNTYAIAIVGLLIVVLAGTAVAISVRGVWSERMDELERKLAEEREAQAERMRIAHVATGAGTWEHDVLTGTTQWSTEMDILYGRCADSPALDKAAWCEMVHPEDRMAVPWCRPSGVGDHSFETTFRIASPVGGWRWIVSRGFAQKRGEQVTIIGMDVDITETVTIREELEAVRIARAAEARVKEAEEAVRQAQKMEALGQTTGGVAHDLNNFLTPIIGYLDVLQRRLAGDEKALRMINMALQSADKAKILVSKLLSFSRRQQLDPKVIDANALVSDMREFVSKTTVGSGVELAVEIMDEIACVRVDPNQFENVLLNLAVNARDAMPNGGTVTMAVERVTGRADYTGVWPAGLANGSYVVVSVSDNGTGMDAETLRKAVEPFYTTKGLGKGTGLGLSMAHGMAGQSGGTLQLLSTPGVGTRAAVWLPEADPAGLVAAAGDDAIEIECGKALRILLVDDDDIVRRSIQHMLMDIGHEVVEVASGAQALAMLAQDEEFDLLVTDYLMPSMTGTDLIKRVRIRRPAMPCVIVSGYTAVKDTAPIVGVQRLAKPFTAARLAEAIVKADAPFSGENVVSFSSQRARG